MNLSFYKMMLLSTFLSLFYGLSSSNCWSGTLEAISPAPGKIFIEWADVDYGSSFTIVKGNNTIYQQNTNTRSGSVTLNYPSGVYTVYFNECFQGIRPPDIITYDCPIPVGGQTVNVLPVCNDYFGNIPQDFNSVLYDIYKGDFDDNGTGGDYLFFGKKRIILIHGEIATPIVIEGVTSVKFIKQANGSYIRASAERICEGNRSTEFTEEEIADLVSTGAVSLVKNALMTDFNKDGNVDFAIKDGATVKVFHWSGSSPELASSIAVPSNATLVLEDVNSDGRADIKVFVGGVFLRVFIANSGGFFVDSSDTVKDPKSKIATIEETWEIFADAMKSGDYTKAMKYVTPHFYDKFSEVIEVLGDEAGEVVEQVQAIAPYYVGNDTATFVIKKLGDDGEYYVHTVTFNKQKDGSWKIEEM